MASWSLASLLLLGPSASGNATAGWNSPEFFGALTHWCLERQSPYLSAVECSHAINAFCRAHRLTYDAELCLLIGENHWPAILNLQRCSSKPAFVASVPDVSILFPYDGFKSLHHEVIVEGRLIRHHLRTKSLSQMFTIDVNGLQSHVDAGPEQGIFRLPMKFGFPSNVTYDNVYHLQAIGWDDNMQPVTPVPPVKISKLNPAKCTPRPDFEKIGVFDAFLFNGEFRLLEVRLHELMPVVESFIIVEYDRSFRGTPKNFTFQEYSQGPQGAWLAPFLHKITYLPISLAEQFPGEMNDFVDAWTVEHFQKDGVIKGLIQAGARISDMVVFGDADEVVRRETIEIVRRCREIDMPAVLELDFYRYNFHWSADDMVFHTGISFVSLVFLSSPVTVRSSVEQNSFTESAQAELGLKPVYRIPHAGWHLSYFMPPEEISFKIGQFSHIEYDTEEYRDLEAIRRKMDMGQDLYDGFTVKSQFIYSLLPQVDRLPRYIQENLPLYRDWLPHYPFDLVQEDQCE